MYSRRFRLGNERFMTRAFVENGFVIITQSLRIDHTSIDDRSEIILSTQDFENMVKTLSQVK